jgi:hypothetical protein
MVQDKLVCCTLFTVIRNNESYSLALSFVRTNDNTLVAASSLADEGLIYLNIF